VCFVYVTGAYDDEDAAARAYDLAALKYWGPQTLLNFPVNLLIFHSILQTNFRCLYYHHICNTLFILHQLSNYEDQLKEMEDQSKEEYIGSL